jgi:beta-lactam-binding protein with PASTA domain
MPKNRLYLWGLYALIFVALFFLAANLTTQIFLKGETIIVPDLQGKTVQEAKNELGKLRVSIKVKSTQFSSDTERGRVVSQAPKTGARLKVFQTVQVVVSKGSELVTVPKVTSLAMESVGAALGDAGLRKGAVTLVHTPVAAGRVLLQFPPAEAQAYRDSAVNILVSQGEEDDKYVMPDLISRQGEAVRKALSQMGFRVSISGSTYYPGLDPGVIIRQFPARGFPVQKMTLITIEVSK